MPGKFWAMREGALYQGSRGLIRTQYDRQNRRTSMVDAVGMTVWTYDSLGRLASERGPFGTNVVSVGYDTHGRMTSVVYGAYSVRYSYDVKGRITGITAPEGGYALAYLSNGFKRALVTYPNGVKETRGYDPLTRMTNLVYKKWLTTLLSIDYRHDNGDRRTNEVWSTGRNLSYGYDRAHQLTDVASPARASDRAGYRYDKAGNPVRRTEMGFGVTNSFNNLNQIVSGIWTGGAITVAGAVNYAAGTVTVAGVAGTIYPDRTFDATNVTVTVGTNILTAVYHGPGFTNTQMVATDKVTVVVGNAAYTHDANGNLTGDQNFMYQYDLANRLTNVILKTSNISVLAISYDGLGRRIQVVRNGTTTERYVYLPGAFLVLAILDGSNAVKEFYTHGPDLSGMVGGAGGIGGILAVRYSQQTNSPSYALHCDGMGNVILTTDTQGKEAGRYPYSPYGRLLTQSGALLPRLLYSSKERDGESGLVNFGYRHYNPQHGRWMERDRIGEEDGPNLYAFVGNAAVGYVDSDGEARLRLPGPVRELPIGNWPPRIPKIPRPQFPSPCELMPNEFVRHYYCGKGQPFDLVARGYLPQLKDALKSEIAKWEQIARSDCKAAARTVCREPRSGGDNKIHKREIARPNLYFNFFILGKTTFIRRYDLDVSVDCRTCSFKYDGELRYSIDDRFKDPLDLLDIIPGEYELPGGRPYVIYGHWKTKPFSG